MNAKLEALSWHGGPEGYLTLLDQTALPRTCRVIECRDIESVWHAIRTLQIRGAPAIGIAAAYGVVLGTRPASMGSDDAFFTTLDDTIHRLAASRPTAVNLFWALSRMRARAASLRDQMTPRNILAQLLDEARAIHAEDRATCRAIGLHGAKLLRDGMGVLTHCNAGWLATAEYGTALAAIYMAHQQGKRLHVYADETRPLLQGARLTTWELTQRGVATTLICDSMAAQVMRSGRVQAVITGADRIAANGDTANKIGTYGLAVLARYHDLPFYVAAPKSTFDLDLKSGDEIPIEQREPREITHIADVQLAPLEVAVYNPAFDVTPADLITAIICEHGLIQPVTPARIADLLGT